MLQKTVNSANAPAVEGDFASSNPRSWAIAGPGGLVAGAAGLIVGRFAFAAATPVDDDGTPTTVTNAGAGLPIGIVHREQQALIHAYLAEESMVIPKGFGVEVMTSGDLFVKNAGAVPTVVGMKVFADNATGEAKFGVGGATVNGTTETKWIARSVAAAGELVKISSTP
jgi:hypothetical protein